MGLDMGKVITYNGYEYCYKYMIAEGGEDLCLSTKEPSLYCNGYHLHSNKDSGSDMQFVIIATNNPYLEKKIQDINLVRVVRKERKEGYLSWIWSIYLWIIRNFQVLSPIEAVDVGLRWKTNVYGDEINLRGCRAIWTDEYSREYRVAELNY